MPESVIDLSEPVAVAAPSPPEPAGIELAPAVWPAESRCDDIFRGLQVGSAAPRKKQA